MSVFRSTVCAHRDRAWHRSVTTGDQERQGRGDRCVLLRSQRCAALHRIAVAVAFGIGGAEELLELRVDCDQFLNWRLRKLLIE